MQSITISVRDLVEFILRNGDIVASESGLADPDAMQEGTRLHKKLQKKMGSTYQAEVPLSLTLPIEKDGVSMEITVEGRADGIFTDSELEMPTIDEIKCVYRSLPRIKSPILVHRAQALCYAYIYSFQHDLKEIGIRMTYCHIPTEDVRYFREKISMSELENWYTDLIEEYAKWMAWQLRWKETRNQSIRATDFPFDYREGQFSLVKGVYQSILRKKRLYIEAPTGVGKTISTVFPTVKSIGEGITEKIFYLTAKTITRTVAEETFHILEAHDAKLKVITLTAKEKICVLDKPQCNPGACPRARGHFDRVNDAVFTLLSEQSLITRDTILEHAERFQVCPFEFSLDVSTWCDAIIGDYNYAFDPSACLKRFFGSDRKNDYVFLVDEAHNLVDRAREMYSSVLVKEDFLAAKKIIKQHSAKLARALERCNKELLELKRECDDICLYDSVDIEPFVMNVLRLLPVMDEFLQGKPDRTSWKDENSDISETILPLPQEEKDQLLDFYFELRSFSSIYETLDEKYTIYSDFDDFGNFMLHLQCMDPSGQLNDYLNKGRCAVFFSATLLPVTYYREQLAGREDDYAIYAPSPFDTKNRLLMIGRNVSTKYTRRTPTEYQKIADYISRFCSAKKGNYLIFFPSYKMMQDIYSYLDSSDLFEIFLQENTMSEEAREEFLGHFTESTPKTTLGFCVMGGIFGEGIDLKSNRLIGAVIVGTGLPMVCTENELFREYFDQKKGTGFSYAYQYPGMNKVLQAAGRVIRTTSDRGAILLLDDRFLQKSYQTLFPREWYPYEVVDQNTMREKLDVFWSNDTKL